MPTTRHTVPAEAADPLLRGVVVACRRDAARVVGFALDGGSITPAQIAARLSAVPGVTSVEAEAAWHLPPDLLLRFAYLGQPCIVHEPWGIEGRYWVQPDIAPSPARDLAPLARAFLDHRPAPAWRWLDALTRPLRLRRRPAGDGAAARQVD